MGIQLPASILPFDPSFHSIHWSICLPAKTHTLRHTDTHTSTPAHTERHTLTHAHTHTHTHRPISLCFISYVHAAPMGICGTSSLCSPTLWVMVMFHQGTTLVDPEAFGLNPGVCFLPRYTCRHLLIKSCFGGLMNPLRCTQAVLGVGAPE